MRTMRIEASRGYCGCRHALIYRRNSRFVSSRRIVLSRKRQIRSFLDEVIYVILILAILVTTSSVHEILNIKSTSDIIGTNISNMKTMFDLMEIPNMKSQSFSIVENLEIPLKNEDLQISEESLLIGQIPPIVESVIEETIITDPEIVEEIEEIVEPEVVDPMIILQEQMGSDVIEFEDGLHTLIRYDLPTVYYPNLDFSSFQPYMDYRCIKNKKSPAYSISRSENAYTDEYGLRRYPTSDDQFTINGKDDYIVALGTFYKEKGTAGSRYLIVTSTGMYTAITGDEKADVDTDAMNMFSLHADGTCAGIIEWIVDTKTLEHSMKRSGTITKGPVEELQGEVLQIYKID